MTSKTTTGPDVIETDLVCSIFNNVSLNINLFNRFITVRMKQSLKFRDQQ